MLLSAGGVTLARATLAQLPAVERLQHAAYALNRKLLGVEPLPLQADYADIFQTMEVWVQCPGPNGSDHAVYPESAEIGAALILDTARPDDLLIWSVATLPGHQQNGLGAALLACAEQRARQLGHNLLRLYTGQPLTHLIAWYSRNRYIVERLEHMSDRVVVHMMKSLA